MRVPPIYCLGQDAGEIRMDPIPFVRHGAFQGKALRHPLRNSPFLVDAAMKSAMQNFDSEQLDSPFMPEKHFHLYASSHLDQLGSRYLSDRKRDPRRFRPRGWLFAPESVIVPSRGIGTWLEHYMVNCGEVSMGMDFPLQSSGIHQLLRRLVPELQNNDAYTPAVMKWEVFHLLTNGEDPLWNDHSASMGSLRAYLNSAKEQEDTRKLRAFQLSEKIASLFDQYQGYLPATLSQWAKEEDLDLVVDKKSGEQHSRPKELPVDRRWQSRLWHRLCGRLRQPGSSEAEISVAEAIARVLSRGFAPPADFVPQPVTLFGATMMPPSYLQILKKYSEFAQVNFYYHTPCEEFWGDNVRLQQRRGMPQEERDALLQNTLLADYARQAQSFFNALLDTCGDDLVDNREIGGKGAGISREDTLLNTIQTLILKNEDPKGHDGPLPDFSQADDSLVVHRCHNATRQVEVLLDQLLQILKEGNKGGKPPRYTLNDILVMAPDITQFAPAIKAVFDESPLRGCYAVSDRSLRQTNLLAQTFLDILQLPESRFQYSRIDTLLDSSALCRKFGFPEEQIPEIRQWLLEGRVCLGYDGESRKKDFHAHGIEGVEAKRDEYTWRNALDRMLLSQAMELPAEADDQHPSFGGLLPMPVTSAQGSVPATLGNLSRLLRLLHETCEELGGKAPRTMTGWRELLEDILDRFFALDTDSTDDFALLKGQLRELEKHACMTDAKDARLPLSLVRSVLQGTLERSTSTKGAPFLGGKITCCSLMPMRGVPCKVVAILGLDEGAFPRQEEHLGFSLVNDKSLLPYYVRSKVEEDRYLFLEAVLAPKDKLLLFYKAFAESDGAELPPASVVSQLLNYTEKLRKGLSQEVTTTHPLNRFDPENFRTEGPQPDSLLEPFSFSQEDRKIAVYAPPAEAPEETDALKNRPSSQPPGDPEKVPLSRLRDLLLDGMEAYRRNALGYYDNEDTQLPSDQEPQENDNLTDAICRTKLLRRLRPFCGQGGDAGKKNELAQCQADFRAAGRLPYGTLGENAFEAYAREADKNAETLLGTYDWPHADEERLQLDVDGSDRKTTLTGDCLVAPAKDGKPQALLHLCGGKASTKHLLHAYLKKLLWEATHPEEPEISAAVFSCKTGAPKDIPGRPQGRTAAETLAALAEIYRKNFLEPVPVKVDFEQNKEYNRKSCLAHKDRFFPGMDDEMLEKQTQAILDLLPEGLFCTKK